jgi:hypothetical protein
MANTPDPITSFLQGRSPKLTPEQERRLSANLKRRERYAKKKNLNWTPTAEDMEADRASQLDAAMRRTPK